MFMQLEGTKRFRLSAPNDILAMQPFPTVHPHARQAQKPYDAPASQANSHRIIEAEIGPGEVLWLPAYWYHEVQAVSPTVSMSIHAMTAEGEFFDAMYRGGPTATLPFLPQPGGVEPMWTVQRMMATMRLHLPMLFEQLRPRLNGFDPVEAVVRSMWSEAVRADLGPPPTAKLLCEDPTEADALRVRAKLPVMLKRFEHVPDDLLPIYSVIYLEMVHGYIQFPLGVAFLEQCLLNTPLAGASS